MCNGKQLFPLHYYPAKLAVIKIESLCTTFSDYFFPIFSIFELSFINLRPLYSQSTLHTIYSVRAGPTTPYICYTKINYVTHTLVKMAARHPRRYTQNITKGERNTIQSAYTMYRHLG